MTKNASDSLILRKRLKTCDPHVKKYVHKLEAYLGQLETENAALNAENFVLKKRIHAAEVQFKKALDEQRAIINVFSAVPDGNPEEINRIAEEALNKRT